MHLEKISNFFSFCKKKKSILLFNGLSMLSILELILINLFGHGMATSQLFFGNRTNSFMDFFETICANFGLSNQEIYNDYMFGITYPSLANVLFWLFSKNIPTHLYNLSAEELRASQYGIMLFAFVWSVTAAFLFICVKKACKLSGCTGDMLATFCLLSYGYLYATERGNIVVFCVPFLLIYICWYDSTDQKKKQCALISLAIAAGIKVYPAMFGFLLCSSPIKKNKINACVCAIIYGLIFVVGMEFFFGGTHAVAQYFLNLANYKQPGMNPNRDLIGCSLFYIVKSWVVILKINPIYYASILGIATKVGYFCVFLSFLLCFFEKNMCRKVVVLSCVILLSFTQSFDYCYAFLIIPLIYLVRVDIDLYEFENKVFFILITLILVPYILPELIQFQQDDFNFTKLIKQNMLLLLFLYALCSSIYHLLYKKISNKVISCVLCLGMLLGLMFPVFNKIRISVKEERMNPAIDVLANTMLDNNILFTDTFYMVSEGEQQYLQNLQSISDDCFVHQKFGFLSLLNSTNKPIVVSKRIFESSNIELNNALISNGRTLCNSIEEDYFIYCVMD